MQELYRKDYDGEHVITGSTLVNGVRNTTREWIDNPIQNQHISGRAAIIASGESRARYDVTKLQRHRGGLRGRKKLQTYGTGQLHNEMLLDFFITFDEKKLQECIDSGYTSRATVYTSAGRCLAFPEEFYLLPHSVKGQTAAVATWLACFDGHKEVFLLGFDGQTDLQYHNNIYSTTKKLPGTISYSKMIRQMLTIFNAYPSVEFFHVNVDEPVPEEWLWCPNFKIMSYSEWVSYCDI